MLASQPKKLLQRLVFSQAVLMLVILVGFIGVIREVLYHVSLNQNAQVLGQMLSPLVQKLNASQVEKDFESAQKQFSQILLAAGLKESEVSLSPTPFVGIAKGWGKNLVLQLTYSKTQSGFYHVHVRVPQVGEQLARLDFIWIVSLVVILIFFLGGSYFLSRKWFVPLGRLIVKAKLIESGSYSSETKLVARQESTEWDDLERSIENIKNELESKTQALTQEREELTALMSAISDAIVAVDANGALLFFNSRFALLFGANSSSGLQSQKFHEVVKIAQVLQAFQDALDQGISMQVQFVAKIEKENLERSFNLAVSPLVSSVMDKPVYGAVGIFHDVTDLKRAEQIRIEFVSNVSHELRTPLTSIKGYTDTLIADFRSGRMEDADNFLARIRRNVDRLMSLINDLLDLSSLDNGIELQKSSVNTKELTDRVIAHLEPRRVEKKTAVRLECDAPLVFADAIRLEQVLVNLLENAMKYGPEGGTIRVRWEKQGHQTALRVLDNGPGILPEHQPRLFERFYRIDKARSRELGGTGLGLAIVKHIMQVHGGTVTVHSEVGRGAEFTCLFPDQLTST